ncbi:hypothetical protein H1R20_g15082, partial [Candolleomyces eurysporus]
MPITTLVTVPDAKQMAQHGKATGSPAVPPGLFHFVFVNSSQDLIPASLYSFYLLDAHAHHNTPVSQYPSRT